MLGVCDKIVPGLVAGALAFGHLPTAVPAGPMASGLPNADKASVRRRPREGEVGRTELLAAEVASYHSPGTCTFYGTANSNQLLMDVMGLHLPGAAFVDPDDPLRAALTAAATARVAEIAASDAPYGIGQVVDERSWSTGRRAAGHRRLDQPHDAPGVDGRGGGRQLTWEDFDDLSRVVPMLARMYPSGTADVNHFHDAGGTPFLVGTLMDAGLLHGDVLTVAGPGLYRYRRTPVLDAAAGWSGSTRRVSGDPTCCARPPTRSPRTAACGCCAGTSATRWSRCRRWPPEHRGVQAPARVFTDQAGFLVAFSRGELDRDVVVVVRDQGPSANGMPELHR